MLLPSIIIASLVTVTVAVVGDDIARSSFGCISTVFTIVLENQDFKDVMDNFYMGHELPQKGLLLANMHGVTHPSQPNYFAMVTGEKQVYSDWISTIDSTSIVDLLEEKHLTWKTYQEDYEGECNTMSRYKRYARKHNPFISLSNIQSNPQRCSHIVPAHQLTIDEESARDSSDLPNYIFYTPNLDDDGHDTNLTTSSAWLKEFLEPKLANPLYSSTLFFITFDESYMSYWEIIQQKNHIYSLLLGAGVAASERGSVSDRFYNHYSWLRTIEDVFGLGRLGRNDVSAEAFPVRCSYLPNE